MSISRSMRQLMQGASLIRRMFEEAEQLKQQRGPENVFDLSLGNPILEPPAEFTRALQAAVADPPAGSHRYMLNAGYGETRAAIADLVAREQGVPVKPGNIIMACGAAGASNVIMKALLDSGDRVVIFAPYFVEYPFYARNHGGDVDVVATNAAFEPDPAALEAALTPQTKAVILNSPNNPTGVVYSAACIRAVADVLTRASARFNRPIYLISDEVYRHITYDGVTVPPIFRAYPHSILLTSFAKDLGLPGERIGYVAVAPDADDVADLVSACATATRILGFINAPALMQRVIARCLDARVDIDLYRRNRQVICAALTEAGIEYVRPGGAFYVFPKCAIPDDLAYCRALKEKGVIVVPGSGFGCPGHFRLAYCVEPETVLRAAAAIKAAGAPASASS